MKTPAPSPVSFEPRAGGREVAKLGLWEVGAIWPYDNGRSVRACWSIALPPAGDVPRWALSPFAARISLLFAIADWLDGAGDPRAPMAREQALEARVSQTQNGSAA